jgi:hypothetical protein
MSITKMLRFTAVMMLAGVLSVTAAHAQTPEYSTIEFTEPTDVGGTVLQPGQYLIRVLPGFAHRNRVQITDLDRQTIYATLLTVPHQAGPNAEIPTTMMIFYPAFEGQPRALRTWFAPHPVDNEGHDFVYEESRARQLARAAEAPVVTYTGTITADATPPLRVVTPDARVEPYVAPAPLVTTAPPPVPAPVQIAEVRTLPRTAGKLPLVALLGILAMTGALVLRVMNR